MKHIIELGSTNIARYDTSEKQGIEGKHILKYWNSYHPIPEKFKLVCSYNYKSFYNIHGMYSKLCIVYDDGGVEALPNPKEFFEWVKSLDKYGFRSNSEIYNTIAQDIIDELDSI